jgi:kynureninase
MPDSQEVCRELLKREILVDWRPKAGVRMSPHFYNTDEEIETAIAAVEGILKERTLAAR